MSDPVPPEVPVETPTVAAPAAPEPIVSIIVVSYNTREMTLDWL